MKNFLLISFLFVAFPLFSQENELQQQDEMIENSKMAQSIDALKMAFITKELNLTSEELQLLHQSAGEVRSMMEVYDKLV